MIAALLGAPTDARSGEIGGAYNGASFGPEVMVGYGIPSFTDGPVPSLSVGFRHSFLLLLGDTRLSYVLTSPRKRPTRPDRHALWLHTCIHPLALVLLGSEWFSYVTASPYFEIGLGGAVHTDAYPADVANPALQWSVGAGIDVPLADPDSGQAPWMQLLYRFRTDATNFTAAAGRSRSHVLYLGLSWRINGTLF